MTVLHGAVYKSIRNLCQNPFYQMVAEAAAVSNMFLKMLLRQFCSFPETDNASQVFRAGTPLAFLCTAVKIVGNLHTSADVQCPAALRAINFMRG